MNQYNWLVDKHRAFHNLFVRSYWICACFSHKCLSFCFHNLIMPIRFRWLLTNCETNKGKCLHVRQKHTHTHTRKKKNNLARKTTQALVTLQQVREITANLHLSHSEGSTCIQRASVSRVRHLCDYSSVRVCESVSECWSIGCIHAKAGERALRKTV